MSFWGLDMSSWVCAVGAAWRSLVLHLILHGDQNVASTTKQLCVCFWFSHALRLLCSLGLLRDVQLLGIVVSCFAVVGSQHHSLCCSVVVVLGLGHVLFVAHVQEFPQCMAGAAKWPRYCCRSCCCCKQAQPALTPERSMLLVSFSNCSIECQGPLPCACSGAVSFMCRKRCNVHRCTVDPCRLTLGRVVCACCNIGWTWLRLLAVLANTLHSTVLQASGVALRCMAALCCARQCVVFTGCGMLWQEGTGAVCAQCVLILATASGDRVWQAGNRGCEVSSGSAERGGSFVLLARQHSTICLFCIRSGLLYQEGGSGLKCVCTWSGRLCVC